MRSAALVLALVAGLAVAYVAAIAFGAFGRSEPVGEVATTPRPAAVIDAWEDRQAQARPSRAAAPDRQILFGDLHVHTTFSMDAFLHSLPLMQGEGAHPPADACDFARYCSGLDFFSLNDHAEALTPRSWRESRASVRQCNEVAGDPASPDLVPFLGWEWTQMGSTPETHYGHKNVIFRDVADDRVPSRPIAASGLAFDGMRTRAGTAGIVAMSLYDFSNRQRYFDFGALRREVRGTPVCEKGVHVRELPEDCIEAAATPRELFEKLDQWGFESIVIPHGNAWGNTTPAGVSWDKQLLEGNHDPERQTLLEVYSGHGNSEPYRPWRHVGRDEAGQLVCPEPGNGFVPECWRAGEIIRERCRTAGEDAGECDERAVETRGRYLAAKSAGRFVVPGQTAADWLDSGQCVDCFQPAFDLRPGGSAQYALSVTTDAAGEEPGRFRFGFIASSDTHYARPATGYKEFTPLGMTDAWGEAAYQARRPLEPGRGDPEPDSVEIDPGRVMLLPGGDIERSASFYYTGGLVAVHAAGRDRGAIWDGFQRKEVYGTSGPRILLWFDLLNPPEGKGARLSMGGAARMAEPPRFRARAVGALAQRPGCPEYVTTGLDPARVASLCRGECYHPGDERLRITRIEVVRIRPRRFAGEDASTLIEDPWQVHDCPADAAGCTVEFGDPEYAASGRDAVYYVRAIQEPTPQVNGAGLRCERDPEGKCLRPRPCRAGSPDDDCLGEDEARAWSSPIFVDQPSAAPGDGQRG